MKISRASGLNFTSLVGVRNGLEYGDNDVTIKNSEHSQTHVATDNMKFEPE